MLNASSEISFHETEPKQFDEAHRPSLAMTAYKGREGYL